MLYNKNQVRKANEKKVLHKVGKSWKVVSLALLLAIGGTAVATKANASADSTQSTISALETPPAANKANHNNNYNSNNNTQKNNFTVPTINTNVSYYPGHNGSAASYFNDVNSDNASADKNKASVSPVVQELNGVYGPRVNSLNSSYASASNAANNDSRLASSYSNEANNPSNSAAVSALASKNGYNGNAPFWQDIVAGSQEMYSGEAKSASSDKAANSLVDNIASKLMNNDPASVSNNASAAYAVAGANLGAARARSAALSAANNGANSISASQAVSNANFLRTSALNAPANSTVASANLVQVLNDVNTAIDNGSTPYGLTTVGNSSAVEEEFADATLNNSMSYFASSIASSAESYLSGNAHYNTGSFASWLGSFVNGTGTATVDSNSLTNVVNSSASASSSSGNYAINLKSDGTSAGSLFVAGVKASAEVSLAPYLDNVANSLLASNSPKLSQYIAASKAYTSEAKSANYAVASAAYADRIAYTNSAIASAISSSVTSVSGIAAGAGKTLNSQDAKASVASDLLNSGVTNGLDNIIASAVDAQNLDQVNMYTTPKYDNDKINHLGRPTDAATNTGSFLGYLCNTMLNGKPNEQQLLKDIDSSNKLGIPTTGTTKSSIISNLNNVDHILNDIKSIVSGYNSIHSGSPKLSADGLTNTTSGNLINDTGKVMNSIYASLSGGDTGSPFYSNIKNLLEDSDLRTTTQGSTSEATIAVNNTIAECKSGINALQSYIGDINTQVNNVTGDNNTAESHGMKNDLTVTTVSSVAKKYEKAALLSDGVNVYQLASLSANVDNVKNAVASASTNSADDYRNDTSAEKLGNELGVAQSSANSVYNSAESASASYGSSADVNVLLASSLANSYSNEATSESNDATGASNALNNLYLSGANKAGDGDFANALNNYNAAIANAKNDKAFGVANAKWVYNHAPHFLDVTKGAWLHQSPNYGSDSDKVLGTAHKGDRLNVLGVNFSYNGITRYYVEDVNTNVKGYFTAIPQYTKAAYLNAGYNNHDVSVKLLKGVWVYQDINSRDHIASLPAGSVVNHVTVVPNNPNNDANGFTKVQTAYGLGANKDVGDFFTANTNYVEVVNPNSVNNNTNNNNNNNNNGKSNIPSSVQGLNGYINDSTQL